MTSFRLRRSNSSRLAVAVVCFLVGMLAVMQFRAQGRVRGLEQSLAPPDSAQVISGLVESNTKLRREVTNLEDRVSTYQTTAGQNDLEILVSELNRMKLVNGLIEASGPGVEVQVTGRITIQDMQDMINELRNAGAEAIAVNNRRVVANSVIGRQDGDLVLDGVVLKAPYTLRAIGQPETLERAVERKGGLIPLLRYNNPQLQIEVTISERLVVPVYEGEHKFAVAQPDEKK